MFSRRQDFEDRYFLDALYHLQEMEAVSNVGACGFGAASLALAEQNGLIVASNLVRRCAALEDLICATAVFGVASLFSFSVGLEVVTRIRDFHLDQVARVETVCVRSFRQRHVMRVVNNNWTLFFLQRSTSPCRL